MRRVSNDGILNTKHRYQKIYYLMKKNNKILTIVHIKNIKYNIEVVAL